MKVIYLFFFLTPIFGSDFTNRTFVFPNEKKFVSDLRFSFKRWNYEYEDEDIPLNEDILEVEKQAILFEPELRYGLNRKAALLLSFIYQFEVLFARLEEQVGTDENYIKSKEERALHSPKLGLRYRLFHHSETFLDLEGSFLFKTHKNLDPTFADLNSQIVNGAHQATIKSFFGMKVRENILKLHLAYNHYFDYDKRFALFDETYNASSFYNIVFSIAYTFIFSYGDDLDLSIQSGITDNYNVKSGTKIIHFKENVTRQFGLRYTNYTFKDTIGQLYFDFKQVFELNSFSYAHNSIHIESDNTYTTFGLGLTTSY